MIKSKYPKTSHLPWSNPNDTNDRTLTGTGYFFQCDVVVTLKMDGENTNMYRNDIHARSPNSGHHPSRGFVKALHANIKHGIPYGWRVCGENLYAKHSIHYKNLDSYFMVFAVYDREQNCLSWDDTVAFTRKLGLMTVPVLYRGKYDQALIERLYQKEYNGDEMEGYVVRIAESFPYDMHRYDVAKFVRPGHIKTSEHWLNQKMIKNELNNSRITLD